MARPRFPRNATFPALFPALFPILFAMPAAASAQEIAIVQSGADGRYERQIDPRASVQGVDAASFRRFRAAMDRLVAGFAAMPAVNAPPAPVCHRLKSFIETTRPHGVLSGSVAVMSPIKFENGRCHRMTGGGIELTVNRADAAFERSRAQVAGAEGGRADWFVMKPEIADGVIRLANGAILVTNGKPLLIPVSGRRYAVEQTKREDADLPAGSPYPRRWRDLSQRLPAAVADRQACLDETMLSLELTDDCLPLRRVWEVNPDYFDKRAMGDAQLIVLRTPQGRYHGESDARLRAREALWASIDIAAIAALMRG
ncbi:hypothetical protein [Sphingomonas colocasiae]|uniref:DUF1311 domain-containing protein n=1 Tax=Sphingomonas colocasiae TaxID=1848973 RepID=A0ABS7PVS6_9SPHN|nr:hypothetical protein [Sphingomonas colocasiae]MBY8825049.1 hypothetical protein [Sphingomonas colocasiae]